MANRILILSPRLDVPFKNIGFTSSKYKSVDFVRSCWGRLVDQIHSAHKYYGDFVELIERPLWEFDEMKFQYEDYDRVYVPHREHHSFPVPDGKALYYMQSVFPWMFYIDPKGFAGGSSLYPFVLPNDAVVWDEVFESYQYHTQSGQTKFSQLETAGVDLPNRYILFACQIPHDHTIIHHSDYMVERALALTCETAQKLNQIVLVKGHPVNPDSMAGLKKTAAKFPNAIWMDHVHIRDAITNSSCVVVVNSGTGMEALLLEKPVITFGRCEYDIVANKATDGNIQELLTDPQYDIKRVKQFFTAWNARMYNCHFTKNFDRLVER